MVAERIAALRRCQSCEQELPLDAFYLHRGRWPYGVCAACHRQRVMEWRRRPAIRPSGAPPPLPYVGDRPRVGRRLFTQAEAEQIRAAYASGWSMARIAVECGVGDGTVYDIIHGRTYRDRGRGHKIEQFPAMVRAWVDGERQTEIAARYGCSYRTVSRALAAARRAVGEDRWARIVVERKAVRGGC